MHLESIRFQLFFQGPHNFFPHNLFSHKFAEFMASNKGFSFQAFWPFLVTFTHKGVISQLESLKQITNETGLCRVCNFDKIKCDFS